MYNLTLQNENITSATDSRVRRSIKKGKKKQRAQHITLHVFSWTADPLSRLALLRKKGHGVPTKKKKNPFLTRTLKTISKMSHITISTHNTTVGQVSTILFG